MTSLLIQEIDTIITCSCHSKTVYLRLGIYWLAYMHELLDCNMEHCVHLSAHPRQCEYIVHVYTDLCSHA